MRASCSDAAVVIAEVGAPGTVAATLAESAGAVGAVICPAQPPERRGRDLSTLAYAPEGTGCGCSRTPAAFGGTLLYTTVPLGTAATLGIAETLAVTVPSVTAAYGFVLQPDEETVPGASPYSYIDCIDGFFGVALKSASSVMLFAGFSTSSPKIVDRAYVPRPAQHVMRGGPFDSGCLSARAPHGPYA